MVVRMDYSFLPAPLLFEFPSWVLSSFYTFPYFHIAHTFNIVFGLGIKLGFLANMLYCMVEGTGQNEKPMVFWNLQCFMICGKACASLINFKVYGIILLLPSFFYGQPTLCLALFDALRKQDRNPFPHGSCILVELNVQHKRFDFYF